MSKTRDNEQGIIHILFIVIAVVILGALGYLGWRAYSTHQASNPPTTSNTAVNNACLTSYHDTNLCNFAAHSTSLDKLAYNATLKITNPQGVVSTMTVSNDGKGNNSSVLGSGTQQVSTIQLNGAMYMQSGGTGTWMEYPAGTSGTPSTSSPTSDMNVGVGTSGISFKYVDTEACDTFTCYKYQVSDASQTGVMQYVLFDKDSYLLREWMSTSPTNGSVDMSITYGSVTISTPSPVQVFSATSPSSPTSTGY